MADNTTERVLAASVLAPLVIGAVLWLPSAGFAVLLSAFLLAGAWEWSRLSMLTNPLARMAYVAALAVLLWMLWPFSGDSGFIQRIAGLTMMAWAAVLFWLAVPSAGSDDTWFNRLIKLLVGVAVLAPAWLTIVALHRYTGQGPQLVLFLMMLTWAADIGAYFAGHRWGRVKLAPSVSPGKTREGVYGGLAAVALYSLLGGLWFDLGGGTLFLFVLLSVVTALVSVVGDLFESLFKRQAGIKDSGRLIPGHGGVMDRIDSLTAAAPMFVLGLLMLELV